MDSEKLNSYINQGQSMVEKYLMHIVSRSGNAMKKEQLSITIHANLDTWILYDKKRWQKISLSQITGPIIALVASGKIKKHFISFSKQKNIDIRKMYASIYYENGKLKSCIEVDEKIIEEIDFEKLMKQEEQDSSIKSLKIFNHGY